MRELSAVQEVFIHAQLTQITSATSHLREFLDTADWTELFDRVDTEVDSARRRLANTPPPQPPTWLGGYGAF